VSTQFPKIGRASFRFSESSLHPAGQEAVPLPHGLLRQLKNPDRVACEIAGCSAAITSLGVTLLDFVRNTFVAIDQCLSLRGETECAECLTLGQRAAHDFWERGDDLI
jgi:hypothetical protein